MSFTGNYLEHTIFNTIYKAIYIINSASISSCSTPRSSFKAFIPLSRCAILLLKLYLFKNQVFGVINCNTRKKKLYKQKIKAAVLLF